jgi:dienelactone hydrolase
VNYYGACRKPELHGHTPLLSLNGDADNWGNPAKTCAAFDAKMRPDQPVELHTYPGVVHAFDNPDMTSGRTNLGHPMQYSWQYAPDSFVLAHGFLDRYVRDAH